LTPHPNAEQPQQPPRASLVVVSHNRKELLRRCLQSIEKQEGRDTLQVIVIDNGSTDGSANLEGDFPRLQWVRLPKNFGLTKAWNLGWRAADAPYVFFLHDDTELEPAATARLAATLDRNSEAAAACPLLVGADGQPAPQLGNLPPDAKWRPAAPESDAAPVDYPRGAALMVRLFNIKAIRQIDERYGQFGADADLATQIVRAGRKILLVPDARVRHDGKSQPRSTIERADLALARAVYLGKYQGFGAGLKARIGAAVSAFFGFRFGELQYALSGQKIDGTQG
jgi:N-acetylglucosaminyl-diphospho-decaprenol L-rhamnosyltransferase